MLLLLIAFLNSSNVFADCKEMNVAFGNTTINIDGSIMVNGTPLKSTEVDGKETSFRDEVPTPPSGKFLPHDKLFARRSYVITRDPNKMPKAIDTTWTYFDGKENKVVPSPWGTRNTPYPSARYEFGSDVRGCHISRIISNGSIVTYDRGLCEDLSKTMRKYAQDIEKCDNMMRELSATVELFKSKISSERLQWKEPHQGLNSYESAFMDAADCRKSLVLGKLDQRTMEIRPTDAQTEK